MTTFEDVTREPSRLMRAWATVGAVLGATRKRTLVGAAKTYVTAAKGRYGISQLLGGACASAGVFELWGLGVGLLATGVAVLVAATALERQR